MTTPPIHPSGTRVRLRYSGHPRRRPEYVYLTRCRPSPADVAHLYPYQGQAGVVVQPPWGPRKRNEVVRLDSGRMVNAPAGNLRLDVDAAPGEML